MRLRSVKTLVAFPFPMQRADAVSRAAVSDALKGKTSRMAASDTETAYALIECVYMWEMVRLAVNRSDIIVDLHVLTGVRNTEITSL